MLKRNINNRGFFIVFEGPEGSGKTTQAKLLYKYLRLNGKKVIITREPGGTVVAEKIREIILSTKYKMTPITELLLYEAARAQHIYEVILPALNDGNIVICDRFSYATVVYQGYARNLGVSVVEDLNKIVLGNLKPDLTFLLDIDVSEGLLRAKRTKGVLDRMEQESLEFHRKIREGYLKLFKKDKNIYLINTTKLTQLQTHKKVLEIINKKLDIKI
ncbi:MAG: dTMP kinase [Endomicrobia bacterium]|nr:dTMP kinase [Endomicrobiia bacterium]